MIVTDVTMWSVARRPKWIALLVLALVVAAGFAALGQWQLSRSIESGQIIERESETVLPLTEVAEPQAPTTQRADGQLVEVSGELIESDYSVLSNRVNGGQTGFWVVGHLVTADSASVAIAVGWAPTEAAADAAVRSLSGGPATVTGRYLPGEPPQETDFEIGERSTFAPSALINEWEGFVGSAYGGYIVQGSAPAALDTIDSPTPIETVTLNWLNIFYAAEWVVFAGFAVFMWYRLVRDAWERETEEAALQAAPAGESDPRAEVN